MKPLVMSLVLAVMPIPMHGSDPAADRFAAVDRIVEQAMAEHGVLGVSIAVIDDFDVVHARGFGSAEPGRAVGVDTLFQAASLAKPMSAVVAAAAAEAGRLDFEADVGGMLTSWRLPRASGDAPITLRMLFAHRAGINVSGFPGYRFDEELPELATILGGVRDKNEPIRVVVEPGVVWQYSGGGYLVAQQAVEDVTDAAFEDLAAEVVLDPLGLGLSTYRILDGSHRDRVAVGYRPDGSEVRGGGWHLYPETAAGSLWTTPTEYAAFVIDVMRSYREGSGVVLDQPTARLLLDPDVPVGFGITREEGGIVIGHDGSNEGYRTAFRALPDRGDGVVVMTNSDAGDVLTAEVVDAVAEELDWPWTGWGTPLWMVVAGLGGVGVLIVVATRFVTTRRRSRSEESAGDADHRTMREHAP